MIRTQKNAFFFEKFYRGHDLPHPRRSLHTPPVDTTAPQRTRTDYTAQEAAQAVPEPGRGKYQGRPCPQQAAHRHTRPDAGHAAPVCIRYQTGRAGQIGTAAGLDCLRSVSDRARQNGQKINELFRLLFCLKALTK